MSQFGILLVRIFPHSDLILGISPYSIQIQENMDQRNSKNRNVLRSVLNLQIQFYLVANLSDLLVKKRSKNHLTFFSLILFTFLTNYHCSNKVSNHHKKSSKVNFWITWIELLYFKSIQIYIKHSSHHMTWPINAN